MTHAELVKVVANLAISISPDSNPDELTDLACRLLAVIKPIVSKENLRNACSQKSRQKSN